MTERALVLGGGGITGVAWLLGLLAGLAERGVHLRGADVVIGTSAGSIVGAQLTTGADLEVRYAAQLAPPDGERAVAPSRAVLVRLAVALLGPQEPERVRARIGRVALRASRVPEQERLDVIGARLHSRDWAPGRDLRVTAVDAHTGAFRVFTPASGVGLVPAVAASCAVPGIWPPVTVGDRRYYDGGVRSLANADLAGHAQRVVVLAPLLRGMGPVGAVAPQVAALRRAGAQVALITPDPAALAAIGRNVLDPAHRAAAARAGRAQAPSAVDTVAAVWA